MTGGSSPLVRPLAELQAAVGLLTRLPVGRLPGETVGAAAFPVVGAAVAAAGTIPILLLGERTPVIGVVLGLLILTLLTGAIHLDGLADTADALLAPNRDAAERARRDPRLGTGGVLALLLVVAIETAALVHLVERVGPVGAWLSALAGGAVSRAVPVLVGVVRASVAGTGGAGGWFAERLSPASATIATLLAATIAVACGAAAETLVPGLGLATGATGLLGLVLGAVVGLAIVGARGQLDGDGFGASTELAFAIGLVATAVAVA